MLDINIIMRDKDTQLILEEYNKIIQEWGKTHPENEIELTWEEAGVDFYDAMENDQIWSDFEKTVHDIASVMGLVVDDIEGEEGWISIMFDTSIITSQQEAAFKKHLQRRLD